MLADSAMDNLMRMLERSHVRVQWEPPSINQPFTIYADSTSTLTPRCCESSNLMEVDDAGCPLRDCSNALAGRADDAALPHAPTPIHSTATVSRTTLSEPPSPEGLFGTLPLAATRQLSAHTASTLHSHILTDLHPVAAHMQRECRILPLLPTSQDVCDATHTDARVFFCERGTQHDIRDGDRNAHCEVDMSLPGSGLPVNMMEQENVPPPETRGEEHEPTDQQEEQRCTQGLLQDLVQVGRQIEAVRDTPSRANWCSVARGTRCPVPRTPGRRVIRRGSLLKERCAERSMHSPVVTNAMYSALEPRHDEDSFRGRPLARMRFGRSRAQERRKSRSACDRTSPGWSTRRVWKLSPQKRSLSSWSDSSFDSPSSVRHHQAKKLCLLTRDY